MRRLTPRIALESEELASAEISVADAVAIADAPAEVPAEAAPVVAAAATGAVEPAVVLDAAVATANDAPSLQPEAINPEEVVINAEPESPEVEAETELVDAIEEDQAEIETLAVQVEEAGNVAQALEELCEVLGGVEPVSEQTAKVIHISTQQLLGQVGFTEADAQVVPALESFRGDAAKANTQIALESLQKKIAAIWQTIVEAVKRAIAWVKEFFRKMFDLSEYTLAQIKETKKQVAQIKDKYSQESFFDVSLYDALQNDRSFPVHVGKVAAQAESVLSAQLKRIDTDTLMDDDIVSRLTEGAKGMTYDPEAKKRASGLVGKTSRTTKDGGEMWLSHPFLGGWVIAQWIGPKSEGKQAIRWHIDTPSLVRVAANSKLSREQIIQNRLKVVTATKDDMEECLGVAEKMADAVNDFRKKLADLESLAGKIVAAASKNIKLTMSDLLTESDAMVQKAFLVSAPRWLVHEPAQIARHELGLARSLVAYVKKSLHFYPGAPKPIEAA